MKFPSASGFWFASGLVFTLIGVATAAEVDKVEEALLEVRHVKADLHSRKSSVLGTLPGPAQMAAHQMRCRPAPKPPKGILREIDFDDVAKERAKKLNPQALRKASGRFGPRVLPLGTTGAYVVECQKKMELLVVHVLDNSPATGVLQLDDILIGANGRLFEDTEDPRPEMGNALVESQSPELGGILTLHVVRDRKPMNVKLDLGNKLSYRDTWPFHCEKTKQIRRAALDHVIKSYPWDRRNFWTPTFLLASGDDAALELARRHLCGKLKELDTAVEGRGGQTWGTAYKLINFCEYYLITGDSSMLPVIRYYAQCLAWAQYRSGSWSHGGGGPNASAPGTCDGGYGEINCAGLGAFVALCLARQCGIEPYDHTLPRSIRFYGKFCGANFPYGLGNPSPRGGRMDNGMNSMAAMGFHLLGEDEMADRWARTVCYMWMARERGHAEAIFSAAWGPVGAALAPEEEFHAFMNNMTWAYEMGRSRDGSLLFMRGGRWTDANMTAAMGLFLYLPERRLHILGGKSVFAQAPPKGLEEAAQLYKEKKWSQLQVFLNGYIKTAEKDKAASAQQLEYARKLLAAYQRLERHAAETLKIIEQSIKDDRQTTAMLQLDLLTKMLGEERPETARLRKRLGPQPRKDRPVEKPASLIDRKEIIASLDLGKGGIDNGFAHSPNYISLTNKRGYQGMKPEQIAGFFNHPSGPAYDGAVRALAERGETVLPLLRQLLADTHPGIRAGALATLAEIYQSDSEEYRTEVPPELLDVIKLAQPMTKDASPLVRNAATGLLLRMKIVNEDIYEVLNEMAKLEGAKIDHCVRYGIKDPAIRTRLCMELINTANRSKSKVPSDYKPIAWAVGAHLELCEPYLQTAVDTLNNPEVLMLYGFFSQSPPNKSLAMLAAYSDNPLVLEHLPDILRFGARKRGSFNSYWVPCTEYPHRIVIRLGPEALPIVEAFCKSERALYKRIQSGKEAKPVWWQEDSVEFLETWCQDMQVTVEMVKFIHEKRPSRQTAAPLCDIYLANRPWGAWERQQIRDYFTRRGAEVVPTLQKAVAAAASSPKGELDKQIAAKQAEIDAGAHRHIIARLQKELDLLTDHRLRYTELAELAALIEAINISGKPSADNVLTLCRFYLKRPWGAQYSFVKHDSSYMRAFDETQLAMVRDALQNWGDAALPTMRAFLKDDRKGLAATLKQLDEDEKYWAAQRARLRGQPLARIAREREDLQEIRAELTNLADLIEYADKDRLSREEIDRLCRIRTRIGWAKQNGLIDELLKRSGARAAPVILEHIEREEKVLPELRAVIETAMVKTSSTATKWRYDRAVATRKNIRRGIEDLEDIIKTNP
jgi:hypothetical protein